jgi:hypothetical protein
MFCLVELKCIHTQIHTHQITLSPRNTARSCGGKRISMYKKSPAEHAEEIFICAAVGKQPLQSHTTRVSVM